MPLSSSCISNYFKSKLSYCHICNKKSKKDTFRQQLLNHYTARSRSSEQATQKWFCFVYNISDDRSAYLNIVLDDSTVILTRTKNF